MATLLMNARAILAGPNRNPSHEIDLTVPLSTYKQRTSTATERAAAPVTRYEKACGLVTHHARQTVCVLRSGKRIQSSKPKQHRPTLSDRFLGLPVELQLQVLNHLTYYELMNFRNTSKRFRELTTNHESYIVNNYIRSCVPTYILKLYPPPSKSPVRLEYLTGLVHKQKVSTGLATFLAEQVVKGLMGRRRIIPDGHRAEALAELRRGMAPLIFALFHFLEKYRERKLEMLDAGKHGQSVEPTGVLSPEKNLKIQSEILSQYPDAILSQVHQMYHLLLHLFFNRMTPRTLPIIRSFLRRNSHPPSNNALAQVLVLGGMEEVWQLYKIKGHGKRRRALEKYVKNMDAERQRQASAETQKENVTRSKKDGTRDAKLHSLHTGNIRSPPISTLAQLDVPELIELWTPAAVERLFARKVIRSLDEVSCCGRFVFQLLWPEDDDDDDDDDGEEVDSDDDEDGGDYHIWSSLDGGTLTGDDSSWDGDLMQDGDDAASEYADSSDSDLTT